MAESSVRWSPTDENYPPKEGLLKSEEENEEYEGLSPLAMGLLQAGASMMRNSGWRNRPMTTSEMIGHAIPAGLGGYLNQDARNQQGEAEFYAQQQAEQQAEQLRIQEQQKQNEIIEIIAQVQTAPITNKEKTEIIAYLKSSDPATRQLGLKRFEKLRDEKKAGERYYDEDLKAWIQKDKEGNVTVLKEDAKTYAGTPLGTYGVGTEEGKLILTKQLGESGSAPEGASFVETKPIMVNKEVAGVYLSFLNEDGNKIEKEGAKEGNSEWQYLKKEEFQKIHGSDYPLPDDLSRVHIDKDGEIIGYKLNSGEFIPEGNESWKKINADKRLAETKTYNNRIEFQKAHPNFPMPEGAVTASFNRDGEFKFYDANREEVKGNGTYRVNILDESTGKYHTKVFDEKTHKPVADLGVSKVQRTNVELLKYNNNLNNKKIKKERLLELIDHLDRTFDLNPYDVARYKKSADIDLDKTFDDVTDRFQAYQAQVDNVKRGSALQGKIEGNYDKDKYYRLQDNLWVEYEPQSNERLNSESALRKEYNQLTRDYRIASRGVDGVRQGLAQKNGFGDIMAITSFRIMFEPNSVVREAEFEITSKGAGFWEDLKKTPQKWMDGDKLSDKARATMKKLVDEYMLAIKKRADRDYKTYTNLAKKRNYGDIGIDHPFETYPEIMAGGTPDNYDADFGVTEEEEENEER